MSSRREQKDRLRRERLEKEQEEKQAESRRRRLQLGAGAAGILVIAVIVVVIAVAGGGGSSSGSGAQAGVVTTPPPWEPVSTDLEERITAMGLPGLSETIFHIHALLYVYVDGKKVTVPANIGLDAANRVFSPMHTHDTTGIVHMEATRPFKFTIGDFFNVWGVKFSDGQLGPYKPGGGNVLQTWVDGKQVSDPVNYVLKPHDVVIVGYGKQGSFPHKLPPKFPPGY
jgi:hypothetical protein